MKFDYVKGNEHKGEHIVATISNGDTEVLCDVDARVLIDGVYSFKNRNGEMQGFSTEDMIEMLRTIQKGRVAAIGDRRIKTLAGWQESGIGTFYDYCNPGDYVYEEMVDYFRDILPPAYMAWGILQVGEPFGREKDEAGRFRDTFPTFSRIKGRLWKYCGTCFYKETENRGRIENLIDHRIEALTDIMNREKSKLRCEK